MADESLDVVGSWTELKLAILDDYANAYSQILSKKDVIKQFVYIDGFAGAGTHISKSTGKEIEGSPSLALAHPFHHYYFIDLDGTRAAQLRALAGGRSDVSVYNGDCNQVLLEEVFPKCRYEDFRRALCLLDPYELNPSWEVVETAGRMKSIEIFLNFMIMDANRNVLWRRPDKVPASQAERMNRFWGDDSWRQVSYTKQPGLFGDVEEKASNDRIAAAYRKRLREVARFRYVPDPFPMTNTKGALMYYLFFASNNLTGDKIARDIFKRHRERGRV